jgi:hypothetical protein
MMEGGEGPGERGWDVLSRRDAGFTNESRYQ